MSGSEAIRFVLQLLLTPLPSLFKVPIYRILGAEIHSSARVSAFSILVSPVIRIGPEAKVYALSIIVCGSRFELAAASYISNLSIIHGAGSFIGHPRSVVATCCLVDCTEDVVFGEFSGTSPRCTILTHASYWPQSWGFRNARASVRLGDMVWVNSGSCIGPGIEIPDCTIILPNSSVMVSIPHSSIAYQANCKNSLFPFSLAKKELSRSALVAKIREGVQAFFEAQCGDLAVREDDFSGCLLCIPGGVVQLDYLALRERHPEADHHWLLGYDLPISTLERPDVESLDFGRLLRSACPEALFSKMLTFFRKRYGIRSCSVACHQYFQPKMPDLIEDADGVE